MSVWSMPRDNTYGGSNEGTAKTGKKTSDDKDSSEYPAHIDTDSPYHLSVYRCGLRYLSDLRFIDKKPEGNSHNRPHDKQKNIIHGEWQTPEEGDKPFE